MEKKIETFLSINQHFTLCTSADNIPSCCSCFYAWIPELASIVFKSKRSTAHIERALQNPNVAGTITGDVSVISNIKGLQFSGSFIEPIGEIMETARKTYYKKYPFALAMSGDLWLIALTYIKLTDNTLGIGNKIIWQKETA